MIRKALSEHDLQAINAHAGTPNRESDELLGLQSWPVELEDKRNRMTLEAVEDVDLGRVIDHQAIQAWADSLGTDSQLPPPAK